MEEKKMGRPFKNKERKTVKSTIRFTEEEYKETQKKAISKKMSIADYIRYLIRKDK